MKEYDPEELKEFNGENGKPAYIACQGRVIDLTGSKLWKGGLHMRRHHAGHDLTADINAAPHGLDVIERYPQIGVLRKSEQDGARSIPHATEALLEKYPFLQRHPHPMTVHFPIVFMISAAVFHVLYTITGINGFEVTGWHCLGGAGLFTPVAIMTGLFTWWLNYRAKPLRPVTIKLYLSPLAWILTLTAFFWRLAVPDIMLIPRPARIVYFVIILSLFPLASVIGWFGAQMTFPLERK
jgi:predicted heme/steroid binding protein/uncharacterized membrane protein